jgi:hypothetical protein
MPERPNLDAILNALHEVIAELEHEQWIAWSQDIANTESISPARLARWKSLWVPYDTLSEAEKDQDRVWADRIVAILRDVFTCMDQPS